MLAATNSGGDAYPTSAAGAAGGGAGGPASPTSPYYAPPSGSIAAAEQYAAASDAYKKALARYNQQRTGLLQQYGYQGDIDPVTGMVKNIRVDGGNVHGAFQELLGQQAGEDENALYAAEDRGLHGGLANQAETALKYAHGGQTSQLAQNLLGGLSGLDAQQQDSQSALDEALWQLQHQATTDATDTGDYNPGTVPTDDGTTPPGPSGGRAPTTVRGRVPLKTATRIVTKATNRGEPTSEHGLGSVGNTRARKVVKQVLANAYTSGKKKRG